MSRGIKVSLYILGTIVSVFLIFACAAVSQAATVSQLIDSDTSSTTVGNPGQTMTGLSGDFVNFTMRFNALGYQTTLHNFQIIEYDGTCTTETGHYWTTGTFNIGGSVTELTKTAAEITMSHDSNTHLTATFDSSKCYRFMVYQLNHYVKGSASDVYAGGSAKNGTSAMNGLSDIYFILNATDSYSISIQSPADSSTIYQDFFNWSLNLESEELTNPDGYWISVQYEKNGATVSDGRFTNGGSGAFGIGKGYYLTDGEWTATPYLYEATFDGEDVTVGNLLLEGETISFTLDTSFDPNYTPAEVDCNSGVALQDAICVMIVPSVESTSRFNNLWEPIKTKVPFGYLTLIIDSFNSLEAESGEYTLPTISFFDDLKDVIEIALWVMFGAYVVKRIGKMNI